MIEAPALNRLREATRHGPYERKLWLVGGAVRDALLGHGPGTDFDLVTLEDAPALARWLFERGASSIAPVTYERFGTAMVRVEDTPIELVTARRESYDAETRKPHVEPATLEEDAHRRDFTVNALLENLHTGERLDPTGRGFEDLHTGTLRTPLDPVATFRDDPLRMLRAVRFRGKLGFEYAEGLADAILAESPRLAIVSEERVRDELQKILEHPSAPDALADLFRLGIVAQVLPELIPMRGCEQGRYHHLDVWEHSLLVVRNAGPGDRILAWAALLHDIGKPSTRFVDEEGNTRFFGHETVGAEMAGRLLERLRLPHREIEPIVRLVRNHMRLGSSPTFSASAARRLLRDLGDDTDRLLQLVEADCRSLRPGVRTMDLDPIRARIDEVRSHTPASSLESPLSGGEIMAILGVPPGPAVGEAKRWLTERVLEGDLAPGDREDAARMLAGWAARPSDGGGPQPSTG